MSGLKRRFPTSSKLIAMLMALTLMPAAYAEGLNDPYENYTKYQWIGEGDEQTVVDTGVAYPNGIPLYTVNPPAGSDLNVEGLLVEMDNISVNNSASLSGIHLVGARNTDINVAKNIDFKINKVTSATTIYFVHSAGTNSVNVGGDVNVDITNSALHSLSGGYTENGVATRYAKINFSNWTTNITNTTFTGVISVTPTERGGTITGGNVTLNCDTVTTASDINGVSIMAPVSKPADDSDYKVTYDVGAVAINLDNTHLQGSGGYGRLITSYINGGSAANANQFISMESIETRVENSSTAANVFLTGLIYGYGGNEMHIDVEKSVNAEFVNSTIGGDLYGGVYSINYQNYGTVDTGYSKVAGDMNISLKGEGASQTTVAGSIYAGGRGANVSIGGNLNLELENAAVTGTIYGAGYNGVVVDGNVAVDVSSGSETRAIYGGGYFSTVGGDVNITHANSNSSSIYAGGKYSTIAGNVNILLDNSSTDLLIGGANSGSVAGNVTLKATAGTVIGTIYAGGYMGDLEPVAELAGSVKVELDGTTVYGSLVGGIFNPTPEIPTTAIAGIDIDVRGNSPIGGDLYAGGINNNVNGDINITLSGATIGSAAATVSGEEGALTYSNGNVYGGIVGDGTTVGGNVNLTIEGTTQIHGNVYAAGYGNTVVEGDVRLSLSGDAWNITGSMYGRGEEAGGAQVKGKAIVEILGRVTELDQSKMIGFDAIQFQSVKGTHAVVETGNSLVCQDGTEYMANATFKDAVVTSAGSSFFVGDYSADGVGSGTVELTNGLTLASGSTLGFSFNTMSTDGKTGRADVNNFGVGSNTFSYMVLDMTENDLVFGAGSLTTIELKLVFDDKLFYRGPSSDEGIGNYTFDIIDFGDEFSLSADILQYFDHELLAANTGAELFTMAVNEDVNPGLLSLELYYYDAEGNTTTDFADARGVRITGTYKFVPEPSTVTLSLLALVGLAARRRRKA